MCFRVLVVLGMTALKDMIAKRLVIDDELPVKPVNSGLLAVEDLHYFVLIAVDVLKIQRLFHGYYFEFSNFQFF